MKKGTVSLDSRKNEDWKKTYIMVFAAASFSISLSLNDFEIVLLASRLELEFSCFASLSDNLVFLLICHIICLICIVFACDAKIDIDKSETAVRRQFFAPLSAQYSCSAELQLANHPTDLNTEFQFHHAQLHER